MKFEELVVAAFKGQIIYEKGRETWKSLGDTPKDTFRARARSIVDTGSPPSGAVPLTAFDAIVCSGMAGITE